MNYFTLPDKKQLLGPKQSKIFKKYGTQSGITDFAILLGGYVSSKNVVHNKISKKIHAGCWWTQSQNENNEILNQTYITHINNEYYYARPYEKQIGIKPITKYSEIFRTSLINYAIKKDATETIKYGEYPQWIVEKEKSGNLEKLYSLNILTETGKEYTVDKKYKEYEYCAGKYIRVICDIDNTDKVLSNGREIIKNNIYWIKVMPIEWLANKTEDIMVSKNILIAGIEYNKENEKDFRNTNAKRFLDNTFSKDIIPSRKAAIGTERNEYLKKLVDTKNELAKVKQELIEAKTQLNNEKIKLLIKK